jgi:mRNA interferase RelE/StbE
MKIAFDKSFERDAKKLPIDVQQKLKVVISQIANSSNFIEISSEKLLGAKDAYRIRFGNYRIGLYKEGDLVVLSRVLDRKEIYRYFPKK